VLIVVHDPIDFCRSAVIVLEKHEAASPSSPDFGMMMDPVNAMRNEKEVIRSAGRQAISAFLEAHNCFSILRDSGKMVVFDTRIPIQLAFYALVEHGE
jgi:hypothetical protein